MPMVRVSNGGTPDLTFEAAANPTNKDYAYLIVSSGVANDESASVSCSGGTYITQNASKSGRTTARAGIWKNVPKGSSWSGWYAVTAIGAYYAG